MTEKRSDDGEGTYGDGGDAYEDGTQPDPDDVARGGDEQRGSAGRASRSDRDPDEAYPVPPEESPSALSR
jgi:hypothetical protein